MDEKKTKSYLNSIGKSVFVEFFEYLHADILTFEQKLETLMRRYKYEGSRIRVEFFEKLTLEERIFALRIVTKSSNRVSTSIKQKANALVKRLEGNI